MFTKNETFLVGKVKISLLRKCTLLFCLNHIKFNKTI
jgi:hypothetical protein